MQDQHMLRLAHTDIGLQCMSRSLRSHVEVESLVIIQQIPVRAGVTPPVHLPGAQHPCLPATSGSGYHCCCCLAQCAWRVPPSVPPAPQNLPHLLLGVHEPVACPCLRCPRLMTYVLCCLIGLCPEAGAFPRGILELPANTQSMMTSVHQVYTVICAAQ